MLVHESSAIDRVISCPSSSFPFRRPHKFRRNNSKRLIRTFFAENVLSRPTASPSSPLLLFNDTSRLLFHLSSRQSRDGFSERNEGSSKIFEAFTPPLLTPVTLPSGCNSTPSSSPFLSCREGEYFDAFHCD